MNQVHVSVLTILLINLNLLSDWTRLNSFPATYTKDIYISSGTLYVAAYTGVYKSTDGALSWQQFNGGLANPQALNVNQIIHSGGNLYIATVDGIYKSTNSGQNWLKKSSGIASGGALYLYAESVFENNGVLLSGTWTGIYRSTNQAENWAATNISGEYILAKAFTNYNGILFCAREQGDAGSYKSTNNGLTWSSFLINKNGALAITFCNDDPRLYAGTIGGIWVSTNSGISWDEKNQGIPLDPYVSSIIRINNTILASLKLGGSGIFKSFNNGDSWEDFGQGLPFLSEVNKLILFNNRILAATSAGIYHRDVSELTVINILSDKLPDKFVLFQNYPNPFNPETKIRFTVPGSSPAAAQNVNLAVFDMLGRVVAVPLNEHLLPGTYEVTINGSSLASGVYYYSISAGDFRNTKKMIMVK